MSSYPRGSCRDASPRHDRVMSVGPQLDDSRPRDDDAVDPPRRRRTPGLRGRLLPGPATTPGGLNHVLCVRRVRRARRLCRLREVPRETMRITNTFRGHQYTSVAVTPPGVPRKQRVAMATALPSVLQRVEVGAGLTGPGTPERDLSPTGVPLPIRRWSAPDPRLVGCAADDSGRAPVVLSCSRGVNEVSRALSGRFT